MFIEALEKCNNSSHSLKKGDVVNMREQDALKLVNAGKAKKATPAQIKNVNKLADKGGKDG